MINFCERWDQYFSFVEFACNSIYMDPFKVLYGRRCSYLIDLFELVEMDHLDIDLLRYFIEKVYLIQYRILSALSRQKS